MQVRGPNQSNVAKISLPLDKLVPCTMQDLQAMNLSQPTQPQTPTTSKSKRPSNSKKLDEFMQTNNDLLTTLRSIDRNIGGLNENFTKLNSNIESLIILFSNKFK